MYKDICKYVKQKDVYICPNGIPVSKNPPIKQSHDGFNILFLSNMMKEKGVWDLIEACRILKEKGKIFHCHFIGKWSDITEDEFNIQVQKYNLKENITAHGAIYGSNKIDFFQLTDVFVFPTYYANECFPLVLLEAMEQGIPCISTNEGGIAKIIKENHTGYIIERKRPDLLAEKLEYLINNPNLCQTIGKAGRTEFLKQFTKEQFENKLTKILNSILK